MRVLFVSSEVAPFAKTGGLGDVGSALPSHLHARGHDVLVFAPFYSRVRRSKHVFEDVEGLQGLSVKLGAHDVRFSIVRTMLPGTDLPIHFVRCSQLYDRDGIYTQDRDEHLRFIVLTHAALIACQHLGFSPDIAHANDWQTALLPLCLKSRYAWDRERFGKTKSVLTIHNLAHQGAFGAHILGDTGLSDSADLFHQDQLRDGGLNMMLTGILYADAITTVSPTYAREIQTPEMGMGLDGFLRERSSTVVGVLNGIDTNEWDPRTDRLLPYRYSPSDLSGKEANKKHLLDSLGLPYVPHLPVAGIVSRLTWQKGFELVLEALPHFIARGALQLVVLGSGATEYEMAFSAMQRHFPKHVCFYRGFSNELAHLIEAGSDLFLMPSRFEPCGLNQMYSLRYGTAPVVRATGGLADSVRPFDRRRGRGNGFTFEHFNADGLRWALGQALDVWGDRPSWRRLQQNAMAEDFSWDRQIRVYEDIYRRVMEL